MKWVIKKRFEAGKKNILDEILETRELKTKKEKELFLNPLDSTKFTFKDLGVSSKQLKLVLDRIKEAKEKKERIVIFGDYDCDGVCSTAILWQSLYSLGFDCLPYIPDRFSEGYGIKDTSFSNQKLIDLKPELIITVDNGIVAYSAVSEAKKRGIDVIVVDHHQKDKKLSTPYVLHSTLVCGSALSWFLAKELGVKDGLELVALGTVADQMPLIGVNRSLVKYGLEKLEKTKKAGLKALIQSAGITKVGVYEIGYIIAPRINAMGRLSHALDSLRLLCTNNLNKASELAKLLNQTNVDRQKIVDQVLIKALESLGKEKLLVIEGDYHEGVIGLASGKITEKLYKPSIVISKGEKISKASARSITSFNIIEAIKETGLILEGGGHPMAAGFSIETVKIEKFKLKIQEIANKEIKEEDLEKKITIDLEIDFKDIDNDLVKILDLLEPTGYGNQKVLFVVKNVEVLELKTVGQDNKHVKLKLKQNNKTLDAVWFNYNKEIDIKNNSKISVAFTIENNTWNGHSQIQLKIKDIKTI